MNHFYTILMFMCLIYFVMPVRALKGRLKFEQQEGDSELQESEFLPRLEHNQEHNNNNHEALVDQALELYHSEGEERFRQFLSIQHQIFKEQQKRHECRQFREILTQRLLSERVALEVYQCSCFKMQSQ